MNKSAVAAAQSMTTTHLGLGFVIALIWGVNFIAIHMALQLYPPLLLTALRFLLVALPVFFIPRPAIPVRQLVLISLFLFMGQFALMFAGLTHGMTPGLASIVQQSQVFLTTLFGVGFLSEKLSGRQMIGLTIGLAGLLVIGASIGGKITPLGFTLSMLSATCWAIGNILTRRTTGGNAFARVVWMSLIPPLPMLGLSWMVEGGDAILYALSHPSWKPVLGLLFIAAVSTHVAYSLWAYLLQRYPAGKVAPFTMLVPVFGSLSAWLYLDETLGPLRLAGTALLMAGLVAINLPLPRWITRRRTTELVG